MKWVSRMVWGKRDGGMCVVSGWCVGSGVVGWVVAI